MVHDGAATESHVYRLVSKTELSRHPAIPLLGMHTREPKTDLAKNACVNVHSGISSQQQRLKQPKCPAASKWTMWQIRTHGCATQPRKGIKGCGSAVGHLPRMHSLVLSTTRTLIKISKNCWRYNTDDLGKAFPDTEGHILYNSMFRNVLRSQSTVVSDGGKKEVGVTGDYRAYLRDILKLVMAITLWMSFSYT